MARKRYAIIPSGSPNRALSSHETLEAAERARAALQTRPETRNATYLIRDLETDQIVGKTVLIE